MRNVFLLVALALLIGGTTSASADNPDQAKKKDDSQKVVCKAEDVVGSMIPKRRCMTRADWEKRRAEEKAYLDASPFRRDQVDAPAVKPGG